METQDFDPWEVADTAEQASKEIADRIEQMQRLFSEAVLLADAYKLRIDVSLEVSEYAAGGHNKDAWLSWNSSSKYC